MIIYFCLLWFFTSQSIIFQSCQDGSSWVEPVLKCLDQGNNIVTLLAVRFWLATHWSLLQGSTNLATALCIFQIFSERSEGVCLPLQQRIISLPHLCPSLHKRQVWHQQVYTSRTSWCVGRSTILSENISEDLEFPVHKTRKPQCPRYTKCWSVKLRIFSYPSVLTFIMGAQKKCHIETVLLSTHNIWFSWYIRKLIIFFYYPLLSGGLIPYSPLFWKQCTVKHV